MSADARPGRGNDCSGVCPVTVRYWLRPLDRSVPCCRDTAPRLREVVRLAVSAAVRHWRERCRLVRREARHPLHGQVRQSADVHNRIRRQNREGMTKAPYSNSDHFISSNVVEETLIEIPIVSRRRYDRGHVTRMQQVLGGHWFNL